MAEETKERIVELKRKMLTLEWDKSHNQLNSGMESKYLEMREECARLEQELEKSTVS